MLEKYKSYDLIDLLDFFDEHLLCTHFLLLLKNDLYLRPRHIHN